MTSKRKSWPLVPDPACKELWSHRACPPNKKKANPAEDQQLFSDPSENWDYTTYRCSQSWRDGQVDTQNHSLPEQKPLWKQVLGLKALKCNKLVTGDSMWTSLRVTNARVGSSLEGLHTFLSFTSKEIYQVLTVKIGEKSLCASSERMVYEAILQQSGTLCSPL